MELCFKRAPHLIGHVYEHIVGNRYYQWSISKNLFRLTDTEFFACTDNDVVVLGQKKLRRRRLERIMKGKIQRAEIKQALEQISCEYQRSYKVKDWGKLEEKIANLNSLSWQKTGGILKPKYEEEVFEDETLMFLEEPQKITVDVGVVYALPSKYDHLRPLAVYLFYAIALEQIVYFYLEHACFDADGKWQSFKKNTAFAHTLRFSEKDFIGMKKIRSQFKKNLDELRERRGLVEKIQKYLCGTAKERKYFGAYELFEYSGYFLDDSGWKKLASAENLRNVLEHMEAKIERIS